MIDKKTFSFSRYGVNLSSLKQDQIELVRRWRNTPRIRDLMLDKQYISTEQQQLWFDKVWESEEQLYLLVSFKQEAIGMASLINIDPLNATCEPGMYIYSQQYQGNIIPFSVAFALNDIAFEVFNMVCLKGKIYQSNKSSVRFHKACGYQSSGLKDDLLLFELEQQNYLKARDKLSRFMRF